MNLTNPRVRDCLDKTLEALDLTAENEALARTYLTAPVTDDTMLENAQPQGNFRTLSRHRIFVMFHQLDNIRESEGMDYLARAYKLLWAIGGSSVAALVSKHYTGRVCNEDSPRWRAKVLGNARAALLEAAGYVNNHYMGQKCLDFLCGLAQNDPRAMMDALDLCEAPDSEAFAILSGLLIHYAADQSAVKWQRQKLFQVIHDAIPHILMGMPMGEIRAVQAYMASGDLDAPVPVPPSIKTPAVDAISAQYAWWNNSSLRFYTLAALLAASDNRIRCALRAMMVLDAKQLFYEATQYATDELFERVLPVLKEDIPGGGACMLILYARTGGVLGERGKVFLEACADDFREALQLAEPDAYLNLLKLGQEKLPTEEVRVKIAITLSRTVLAPQEQDVYGYLMGGQLENTMEALKNAAPGEHRQLRSALDLLGNYISTQSLDDFALRCCAFSGVVHPDNNIDVIAWLPSGKRDHKLIRQIMTELAEKGIPVREVLNICANMHEENPYCDEAKATAREGVLALAQPRYVAAFADAVKTGSLFLRSAALEALDALSAEPGAREGVFSAMGDSSKQIKEQLLFILARHPEWTGELVKHLGAKKAAERLLAAQALGKLGQTAPLEAALATEKNAKVADAIREAIGASAVPQSVGNADELAQRLLRGGKVKKLAWLTDKPLPILHDAEGKEVSEDRRNAILLAYSELSRVGRSETAAQLAEGIHENDLKALACEVYEIWFAAGAQAKQKWVLSFAAVFGGAAMTPRLQKAINDWPNHQRGAIACDAVFALALSSDPAAIVIVDAISRKFKFRQVKTAAAAALENAAKELGISAEELADRIVPDLGFGTDGKRIFDYGKRSFTVRLTPTLELEITNDQGKTVKNLPAPGKTDDPIAAEAYESFKAMKKQIRTTVSAQRSRLEAALSNLRCWDKERWQALFVGNPIMHQFAISLVWGIYADGKLTDTFRYMEDGSFTTVDEDEYTLPENAFIGLVHPVELDEDTLGGWKQQLEDYEISQSIVQLDRPVFRMDPDRAGEKVLEDFGGKKLNGLSLSGKLLGAGWYRGSVVDAGGFFDYCKEDAAPGIGVQLNFSGSYVGDENDTVTVYDAVFYKAGTVQRGSYVYDKPKEENILPLSQIPVRCYSEIMYHLTRATASSTETDENWKQNRTDA